MVPVLVAAYICEGVHSEKESTSEVAVTVAVPVADEEALHLDST